jgi:hypothetical protein
MDHRCILLMFNYLERMKLSNPCAQTMNSDSGQLFINQHNLLSQASWGDETQPLYFPSDLLQILPNLYLLNSPHISVYWYCQMIPTIHNSAIF